MSVPPKQTRLWATREGTKIRVCDMGDEHLVNSLKMLKRQALSAREDNLAAAWSAAAMFNGDMATYYAEQEADRVSDAHWIDYMSDFWEPMQLEAHRRGGEVARRAADLLIPGGTP